MWKTVKGIGAGLLLLGLLAAPGMGQLPEDPALPVKPRPALSVAGPVAPEPTPVPLPVKKPARASLSSRSGRILGSGPPPRGVGRRLTVTSCAYHLPGRTASGSPTRVGAVAVDPAVIPLGSRIWIPGYGWGRAEDTGGGIKGHKIDVWLPTARQCRQWGVRKLTIVILEPWERSRKPP